MWWDGCYAVGDGCKYCFFYGLHNKRHGQNEVTRANDDAFYAPLDKTRFTAGEVLVPCLTSGLFIPEADEWRKDAWRIIKARPDLIFCIVTKRIDRFYVSLPDDWGYGYDNVDVRCGVEDQATAEERLPLFLSLPIKYKGITCMPLIGDVDLTPYLHGVNGVSVGGEWGRDARPLDFEWVQSIQRQCMDSGVSFNFWRTGQRFRKDGVLHKVSPFRKRAAMRDLGVDNIKVHIKRNITQALVSRGVTMPDGMERDFLLHIDEAMGELAYDFNVVIGHGTTQEPAIINYTKFGSNSNPAVRVFICEGNIMVRLLLRKLTPYFSYIASASSAIKNAFTARHDNCMACATPCRTRDKYIINGQYIQKCCLQVDLPISVTDIDDYMALIKIFFV